MMSKAREIAEERFAKGEITKKELDSILSDLQSSSNVGSDINNQDDEEISGAAIYFSGLFFAYLIAFIKFGFVKGLFYGLFLCWLSWLYVGFALLQAIFG